MFGKFLFIGILISSISVAIYSVFDYNENQRRTNNEKLSLFAIIFFVSFLIMFLISGNSESIVPVSQSINPLNTNAPF